MNNIYVDELPKNCRGCHCLSVFDWCNCLKDCVSSEIRNNERPASCPLKPLSDRLAEERKKVVQMIKAEFEPSPDSTVITGTPTPEAELINRGFGACKRRFYEILDKIERGE